MLGTYSCHHPVGHSLSGRALSHTRQFPPKAGTQCPCFHPAVSHRVLVWALRTPISRCGPGPQFPSCCICPHVPRQASQGQCRWELAGAGPSTSVRTTDPLHSPPPGTQNPLPAQALSKSSFEFGVSETWGSVPVTTSAMCYSLSFTQTAYLGYQGPEQLCGWMTRHRSPPPQPLPHTSKPHSHLNKAISLIKCLGVTTRII